MIFSLITLQNKLKVDLFASVLSNSSENITLLTFIQGKSKPMGVARCPGTFESQATYLGA